MGKPIYERARPFKLLKNIKAAAWNKLEIMTNPTGKIDSAGNSGIINIKTKRNVKGMNGSANLGIQQGFYGGNNKTKCKTELSNTQLKYLGVIMAYIRGNNKLNDHRNYMTEKTKTTLGTTPLDQVSRPYF